MSFLPSKSTREMKPESVAGLQNVRVNIVLLREVLAI